MQNRRLQLLLHPVFIYSLLILLLNDFYLKYHYHNWLTGKLSDFAGLFAFTLFLTAFFYHKRVLVCFAVAIFFVWWKTPFSQLTIDLANRILITNFHRTVDYSDLAALPVIFLSLFIQPANWHLNKLRQITVYFIALVSFFAFTATSYNRKFSVSPDTGVNIEYYKSYNTSFTKDEILSRLRDLGYRYRVDSFTTAPLRFYGGSLIIETSDSQQKKQMIIGPSQKDTAVFFRINEIPHIIVMNLKAGKEIIPQIRIRTYKNDKSNTIILESIKPGGYFYNEYMMHPVRTKTRMRRLAEELLINNLR